MMSETDSNNANPAPVKVKSRVKDFLVAVGLVNFVFLIFHPTLTCGCHFCWEAFAFSFIPLFVGSMLRVMAKTRNEKIVSYIGLGLGLVCLWLSFTTNGLPESVISLVS